VPSTQYRPEIDGLRAVAVMGVVLYHAGLGFPGGYVGVDVFFVISGFLITSIILKNLEKESFSLIDFWVRRIRRIIPAVSVLVLCVLGAGLYLLDPKSMQDLARSSMAQALMLANVFFWQDTGYFTEAAEYKPLLHTWTLAVEEQFYLFFPAALVLVHKVMKKRVFLFFSIAAIVSLLLSIYFTTTHQSASFFLLPTRAWELLAGSLLAMMGTRGKLGRVAAESMAVTGLLMISASMFLYDSATPFPGYQALLPVVGAAVFIWGCQDHSTIAGRFLSIKPFVFLGLISYSLYLWHWPIFSFARFLLADIEQSTAVWLIALSIGISFISWKFIENPFRKGILLSTRGSAYRFGFSALAILFVTSSIIWKLDGLSSMQSPAQQILARDISWKGNEYGGNDGEPIIIGDQSMILENDIPDFVLWGDSHARVYTRSIDRSAKEQGLYGEAYLVNGKIPVTGLWRPSWSKSERNEYLEASEQVVQSIINRRIPNLILACRWSVNCDGRNQLEIDQGSTLIDSLVTDSDAIDLSSISRKLAAASFRTQLEAMLDRLTNAGVRVWIIKQVPETNRSDTAKQFYFVSKFPRLHLFDQFSISPEDHDLRQVFSNRAIDGLDSSNVTIIDPSPVFFNNEQSLLKIYADRSYYRDDDHLTSYGIEELLSPLFDEIIKEIKSNQE